MITTVLTTLAKREYRLAFRNFFDAKRMLRKKLFQIKNKTEIIVTYNSHFGALVLKNTLSRKGKVTKRMAMIINENKV